MDTSLTTIQQVIEELVSALDDLANIETAMRMNMLMHKEYKDQRNAALHRIDKAKAAASALVKKLKKVH